MYRSAKYAAKRRGITFDLEVGDIHIPETCPYLGVPITNNIGEGFQDYNPSLDRIDSNGNYTKDNIEVVSVLANRMKSTATVRDMQNFALGVLQRWPL